MSACQVVEHIRRMHAEGLLSPKARTLATHIAHEGNLARPELERFAKENGYEVAYHGLVFEI